MHLPGDILAKVCNNAIIILGKYAALDILQEGKEK
jgi:hypothetical protein